MKVLNNVVSIFVVTIVLAFIIPLPPWMLDFLFILNITLSIIILLMSMYIKSALEFSVFPSMLLVTTLFRLALNISSTRLILSQKGQAGNVIAAIGDFVLGGNPVIGFIIFIIIVIVQLVVITKGAERVSEVAARFTLDAMPGKQMAIDADLNSGLIDEQQARKRRSDVQREADFFGSMDGASKFVKGDAIISIVIAAVNLLGGAAIGMISNGMSIDQVLKVYSIATVGDGLVSQIPAFLISTATAMLVTRTASENNFNIELLKQFSMQPTAMIIAGVVAAVLGFIPGFPTIQIIIIAIALIVLGIALRNSMQKTALASEVPAAVPETELTETSFYKNIDNVYTLLTVEQIEMTFGYSLLPLVDESSGGSFIDRVVMFRKQFALDMGMVIPSVRMRDNGQLNPNQYSIKLKGEEVARGEVLVDHFLALSPGEVAEKVDGIDTIEPAFGIPAKWITESKREFAEMAGYTVIDPTSVIITHLSEVIKEHAHEMLTRQEVNTLINNLKKANQNLIEEVIPNIVSVGELQKVLANLLKEGIPIRDMETIIETLGDYGTSIKDADMLTEYVRQALRRTITRKFSDANQLRVITLDTATENLIMNSVKKSDHGSYLALDPDTVQKIATSLVQQVNKVRELLPTPIILTSPIVRIYFRKLADQFVHGIVVLSFSEIDNSVQIQAIGNISV
ncbi:flagellar biosynthesis protein FlhA [Acetanaerobacterium elongatum]|uniref:Flagellar biosynthesis protein FlhA n=1 Tax=Acetanaerobacterium elongatum TaxID=258515 RepID=A0A1G9ZFA6_9FIRM|nr:flagellar biosynthesis protein FlhA [Acetanaerobacterium elongatum]SDN19671.1 flagellar biosynthesis protein FlhA [Acetanaerobacterium elongatum]